MMPANVQILLLEIYSLTYFDSFKRDKIFKKLIKLLYSIVHDLDIENKVNTYTDFIAGLFKHTDNLSRYVWGYARQDMNAYLYKCIYSKTVTISDMDILQNDLNTLQKISDLNSMQLKKLILSPVPLADWKCSTLNIKEMYNNHIESLSTNGYGKFLDNYMFNMRKRLHPIKSADNIKISDLYGYESQQNLLSKNTNALLNGEKAANALLYGGSGTGKSSTVKAIVNKYHSKGLRLIEIDRNYLHKLPKIINDLSKQLLKFILFLDDLSFIDETESFCALKIALEGSLTAASKNIAIYATSNRRHLIKESFTSRTDDDIHTNETIQQLTALSQRFGLQIYFPIPDKTEYLNIIDSLAEKRGIVMPSSELHNKAEAYAIKRGGRSPRVANQFINQVAIGVV